MSPADSALPAPGHNEILTLRMRVAELEQELNAWKTGQSGPHAEASPVGGAEANWKPVRFAASLQDMAESWRAQEALRESSRFGSVAKQGSALWSGFELGRQGVSGDLRPTAGLWAG